MLRRWNLDNLDSYWAARLEDWRQLTPTDGFLRHRDGLPWLVLGIPRLHHTIATLNVTSKTGAGKYALEVVDRRWHPVVKAALSVRLDPSAPLSTSPEALREDAVELGGFLIQSAHTIVD